MIQLAIGIPTRNRADLAMTAVESVLDSNAAGVTVVVSDNSTDGAERERLADFCAGLASESVGYVRPPASLPMTEHWEWLWREISDRVAPSHVAYLTDRLAFVDGALAELLAVVASQPGQVVSYHWDHVNDSGSPAELVQLQWTGRVLELDTRRLIEMEGRGAHGRHLPRLMNAIAPVETVREVERRFGNVFGSVSPDFRFAYRCLAVRDTVLYLDRGCVVEHGTGRSAGVSYLKGNMNRDATDFAGSLAVERFGATPEPRFETVANAIFQEYCSTRAETGPDVFPAPDRRSYLAANAASVSRIADPDWRARMEELLRRHGWRGRLRARHGLSLVAGIAGYYLRHPGALARSVRRQLWDRPPGTPLAFILPRLGLSARVRDDLRFESGTAALAHARSHPRPRTPYAWHVHRLERAGAVVRSGPPPTPAGSDPAVAAGAAAHARRATAIRR